MQTTTNISYIKSGATKLKDFLSENYFKILLGLFEGSNVADYLITADGWSKGRGGEENEAMLKMMIQHGPYVGGGIVAGVEGILTPLYAYTGKKILEAIPELHKYPRIKKVFPALILIWGTSRHIAGVSSWLR